VQTKILLLICTLFILTSCTDIGEYSYAQESSNYLESEIYNESDYEHGSEIIDDAKTNSNSFEWMATMNSESFADFGLISGGYLTEYRDNIYFMNPEDNYTLYCSKNAELTDAIKLNDMKSDTRFGYMHIEADRLYYTITERIGAESDKYDGQFAFLKQVLCYDTETNITTPITEMMPIISFTVTDNYVYYVAYDETIHTYALFKEDGTVCLELDCPMNIQADSGLLFLGFNERILIYDIQQQISHTEMMIHSSFVVVNDNVFFTSLNDGCLYKTNYDITNFEFSVPEQLTIHSVDCYTITENALFLSSFDEGIVYEYEIGDDSYQKIAEGNAPILTNNGVYYINSQNSIEYIEYFKDAE